MNNGTTKLNKKKAKLYKTLSRPFVYHLIYGIKEAKTKFEDNELVRSPYNAYLNII